MVGSAFETGNRRKSQYKPGRAGTTREQRERQERIRTDEASQSQQTSMFQSSKEHMQELTQALVVAPVAPATLAEALTHARHALQWKGAAVVHSTTLLPALPTHPHRTHRRVTTNVRSLRTAFATTTNPSCTGLRPPRASRSVAGSRTTAWRMRLTLTFWGLGTPRPRPPPVARRSATACCLTRAASSAISSSFSASHSPGTSDAVATAPRVRRRATRSCVVLGSPPMRPPRVTTSSAVAAAARGPTLKLVLHVAPPPPLRPRWSRPPSPVVRRERKPLAPALDERTRGSAADERRRRRPVGAVLNEWRPARRATSSATAPVDVDTVEPTVVIVRVLPTDKGGGLPIDWRDAVAASRELRPPPTASPPTMRDVGGVGGDGGGDGSATRMNGGMARSRFPREHGGEGEKMGTSGGGRWSECRVSAPQPRRARAARA